MEYWARFITYKRAAAAEEESDTFGTSFISKDTGVIGAMGDIGCYSLDMVLNAIGYPKPLTVTGYTSDFFGKDLNYSGYAPER